MTKYFPIFLAVQIGLVGCASAPRRSDTAYYRDSSSSQPVYVPSPQQSAQAEQNKKILKQAVLGAATGAIAAEASGGKAGTGALVGAGTNVLGGALFDMLTAPQPQQTAPPQYAPYVDQWRQENQGKKKIVRKYDSNGNVVSEEEVWQ
jgi:hypothetical protein